MKYRHYLESAPDVSEIGLGTWQLGTGADWAGMSEKAAVDLVHQALESGVNFFDTAPNYGNGTSERRLGKALRGTDRSRIVINTKFGHTDSGETNFAADYLIESLQGSLERLQTDYVDSLIIHNPPLAYLDGNNNAHYEILERLKGQGKIKAYGASLDTCEEMQLFMRTTKGEVIEAFFNILHQDAGRAFDLAKEKAVGIIAKIPLDSGWLSGKYHAESTFDDIRSRWTQSDIRTRAGLVGKLKTVIPQGDDLAQTAISFCLAYDAVSTVIPGNRNIAQLKANLASTSRPIAKELVERLEGFYRDEVERLGLPW
jgi:aryl-alcohol dehydrogenase-like predicted oxidoreductase